MTDTELTLEETDRFAHHYAQIRNSPGCYAHETKYHYDRLLMIVAAARKHIEATAGEPLDETGVEAALLQRLLERFSGRGNEKLVAELTNFGRFYGLIPNLAAPSKQEVAGASEGDMMTAAHQAYPEADVNKLRLVIAAVRPTFENDAFNRGLGAGESACLETAAALAHSALGADQGAYRCVDAIRALKNTGETGMPQQELPQASYDYQSSAKIGAGAPCPDCGAPYGCKHGDGCSVMARNLANIQRLGQEFDDDGLKAQVRPLSETLSVGDVIQREIDKSKVSASDLSETESVGAKKPLCGADIPSALMVQPAPSQQGDDDVHAQIQALIARWHRGDHVESVECEAVLREAAAALKTLKDDLNTALKLADSGAQAMALANSTELALMAERDSLSKRVERLEGALKPFAHWGSPEDTDKTGLEKMIAYMLDHAPFPDSLYRVTQFTRACINARAALAEEGA